MPELKKVETSLPHIPPDGYFSLFIAFENGKYMLKARKPDGSIVTILE